MCPDESSDERRGVMPSPPSSEDGSFAGDEATDGQLEFGVYSRIELIRMFLPLQKFTAIHPEYELDQDDESALCSLWDAINDPDIADFYIENGLVPVLKMIISNNNCVNSRLTELRMVPTTTPSDVEVSWWHLTISKCCNRLKRWNISKCYFTNVRSTNIKRILIRRV